MKKKVDLVGAYYNISDNVKFNLHMDNPRSVYTVTKDWPGSKVAAETAAALAASADNLLGTRTI